MAPKTKASTNVETESGVISFIGARPINLGGKDYKPGDELEVSAEMLNSQGMKNLFIVKDVEFLDDSKRTRAYIENVKRKEPETLAQDIEAAKEKTSD